MSEIYPGQAQAARTPGQAAYEAYRAALPHVPLPSWETAGGAERDAREAGAQAAIDAAISASARKVAEHGWPAPDIAALRAELAGLTQVHATLLEEILRNADQDIKGADEAAEYLAEHYVRFLERERDELRARLAAVRQRLEDLAAKWESEAAEFAAEAKRDYDADPELSHREREAADHYRERASELRALLGERAGLAAAAQRDPGHVACDTAITGLRALLAEILASFPSGTGYARYTAVLLPAAITGWRERAGLGSDQDGPQPSASQQRRTAAQREDGGR